MSDQVTVLIMCLLYTFNSHKKFHFIRYSLGTFDVFCGMFCNVIISNVISLVLKDSDTDSGNVSLIWRSVSDGQKTCSSKGVSLMGI